MPMQRLPILFLLLGLQSLVIAQDLRDDQAFFEQQLPVFQSWLEETGLSPALQASRVVADSHKVALFLYLDYADRDTAISAWNRLRRDFQENSALALEERLFFKMAFVLELPFGQAELRILNLPAYGQMPAVDGTIYYDAAEEKVARKGVFRTEVKEEVFIPAFVLDTSYTRQLSLSCEMTEQLRYRLNQQLASRLKAYFEKKTDAQYVFVHNKNPVIVEVMNVKSEVIPAGWFGFTNPNEHLLIIVDHKSTAKGIRFFCTIDGKYGNGLLKPRTVAGFRDMSPEYKAELLRYGKVFTNDRLQGWATEIINDKK
jgi:hypothetical protein